MGFTQVGSHFTCKHYTGLERLAREKHSSLLRKSVNYVSKTFHRISPRRDKNVRAKSYNFNSSFQAHSQYVLANQQMMQHSNTMVPSTTSTSLLTQPLVSSAHNNNNAGNRAHITLNPYSTQLVSMLYNFFLRR